MAAFILACGPFDGSRLAMSAIGILYASTFLLAASLGVGEKARRVTERMLLVDRAVGELIELNSRLGRKEAGG